MWQKKIKKTLYTLNIGFDKEITDLTYPLLKHYAKKCGADFHIIDERKYPEWPIACEKFQIYELAQKHENDWNIYLDSDALIHPDAPDFTVMIPKSVVMHFGNDLAPQRWKLDRFFFKDGRLIGSGNWFTIASDWCIELWKMHDDLTYEEARTRVAPIIDERNSGIKDPDNLLDDFLIGRNIAKYSYQFDSVRAILPKIGRQEVLGCFWHLYTIPREAKAAKMEEVLRVWKLK